MVLKSLYEVNNKSLSRGFWNQVYFIAETFREGNSWQFKMQKTFLGSVFIRRKNVILMTKVVRVKKDISGQFKNEKIGRALPTSD